MKHKDIVTVQHSGTKEFHYFICKVWEDGSLSFKSVLFPYSAHWTREQLNLFTIISSNSIGKEISNFISRFVK